MTEFLLVAINSRFNHTNLAVRSISEFAMHTVDGLSTEVLTFEEWTIANFAQDILRGIINHKPKVVIFSVYIWNTRLSFDVITELRKIAPELVIAVGGPDVSYRTMEVFSDYPQVDAVLHGEGEYTVTEMLTKYLEQGKNFSKTDYLESIKNIQSLYTKQVDGTIAFSQFRPLIADLSVLPFAYPVLEDVDNKLFYYESSRGCPFSCSYCLSSIDKGVRFMPLERVFGDLQRFLDARVKIVKFVDRTFNLNTERYLAIWRYIVEHHNEHTMFHFEISAEHLDDTALDFLQTVKSGVMQFEIGVQTTNQKTLEAIHRPVHLPILAEKIKRIPKTIHSHLDLIAGLPYETLDIFASSFNYTLALKPDMLQLGFLKILSGTEMERFAKTTNYEWLSLPPHEVLSSPDMNYAELCFLHDLETVLDWYYNSHNFDKTIRYLLNNVKSAFELFSNITKYFSKKGVFELQHKTQAHFSFLHSFVKDEMKEICSNAKELIRFDYFAMQKTSVYPDCFTLHYDKDKHHKALQENTDMHSTREAYTNSAFESFSINPLTLKKTKTDILFLYSKRAEKKQDTKIVIA